MFFTLSPTSAKQGCSKACLAVILQVGLIFSSFDSKSSPFSSSLGQILERASPGYFSNSSGFQFGNSISPGQSAWFGVPIILKIFLSQSLSLLPANRGFKLLISAMMHPMLHMSIIVLYYLLPKSTSGGRYHRVTTSLVWFFTGIPLPLASPKSANLSICSLEISKF